MKRKKRKKKREPILSSYIEVRDYLFVVCRSRRCDFGAFVRAIAKPIVDLFPEIRKVSSVSDWLTARDGGYDDVRGGKKERKKQVRRVMMWRCWSGNYLGNALTPSREPIVFTPSSATVRSCVYRFALISSLRPSRTFPTSRPRVLETFSSAASFFVSAGVAGTRVFFPPFFL